METATLGRLIGDVRNALDWLDEAWEKQKRGDMNTRHDLIEAGERLQSAAVQIATDLGWQKEWKRSTDRVATTGCRE